MVEKDEIVYLEDKIDKLFKVYSYSFDKKEESSVKYTCKTIKQNQLQKFVLHNFIIRW